MTALMIVLAVIVLLAILPLGVSAAYGEAGARVRVIAGPVRITLIPRRKKDKPKKKKKEKPKKEQKTGEKAKETPEKKDSGGSLRDFLPLVRVALDFLGELRRKLRVDRLELKLVLAGDDPADLAILYGRANAALGNLWPQLERLFVIKKRDVQLECDFLAEQTKVVMRMDLTITLGRLLSLAVRYGIRALREFIKLKNLRKGGTEK